MDMTISILSGGENQPGRLGLYFSEVWYFVKEIC